MMRVVAVGTLLAAAAQASATPLKFYNGHLFIPATITHVGTEALLDSGAEATAVDRSLAAKAKLPEGAARVTKGTGGTVQVRIVEGVPVGALGIELHPDFVVVLDLSDLSRRLVKRPTQAIVGRELFDAARLRIDISRKDITTVGEDAAPRGTKLPLAGHAGIEAIPVKANGTEVQADFDLGNGSDVLISRALATRLGLKVLGKKSGGGIGGSVSRDIVKLKVLEIAGLKFRDVRAAIDDQPSHNDLNVGTSILKHFLITTDFKQRAVWLEPVGRD